MLIWKGGFWTEPSICVVMKIFLLSGSTTSSFLLVQRSHLSDSGSYSCQPSVGNTARVSVHVIRSNYLGEESLSVSHGCIAGGDPEKWVTNGRGESRGDRIVGAALMILHVLDQLVLIAF